MPEREKPRDVNLSFMKGVHGDAYVLDERTGFASVAVGADGLISGNPEHIALLNASKPQNQSLQEYIRSKGGR